MIDISIIILNYKAKEWVEKNLDALREAEVDLQQRGYTSEVFIVDNSEECDGSCDFVTSKYPDYIVLSPHQNIGFPKGNNLAVRRSKGRYILLLNPDSIVAKNTLSEMISYMDRNPKVGISTCKVEMVTTKKVDPSTHRGFPTPWASITYFLGLEKAFPKSQVFGKYHQTWKDLEKEHEIDICSGTFMLVRREALNDIGGIFSEAYYMYAEDIDTSYQIKNKGWKIMYYPDVVCLHYKSLSAGIRKETRHLSNASPEFRKKMIETFWNDNLIFYNKYFKQKYPFFVNYMIYFAIWLKKQIAFRKMYV